MKTEAGFSILETLFAVTLFGIVSLALSRVFVVQLRTNTGNEVRSEATQAAQRVLDRLRTQDPASMPHTGHGPIQDIPVGDRTYAVQVEYCAESSLCTAGTTRHLRATVSYQSRVVYEVDTVFSQLR